MNSLDNPQTTKSSDDALFDLIQEMASTLWDIAPPAAQRAISVKMKTLENALQKEGKYVG